jgi:hypothetical protein
MPYHPPEGFKVRKLAKVGKLYPALAAKELPAFGRILYWWIVNTPFVREVARVMTDWPWRLLVALVRLSC